MGTTLHQLLGFLFLLLFLLSGATLAETHKTLKIGFGSCYSSHEPEIWDHLSSESFDSFVFLGDNVYLPNREFLSYSLVSQFYKELFQEQNFRRFLQRTEELPIWDDHDFGSNNSDSTFAGKEATKKAFVHFWNQPGVFANEIPGPPGGIARAVNKEFLKFILTDNRSFRINPGQKETAQMFGSKQLSWLETQLSSDRDKLAIIASGGQLTTKGPKLEDYQEYPDEFERFISILKQSNRPIIILSGDRHFADILERDEAGLYVLEATSSPLSGRVAPDSVLLPQVGRLMTYMESANYGVLEVKATELHWKLSITIKNSAGAPALRVTRDISRDHS